MEVLRRLVDARLLTTFEVETEGDFEGFYFASTDTHTMTVDAAGTVITPAGEREVAVDELQVGQVVLIRPGDTVPADGTVRRAWPSDVSTSTIWLLRSRALPWQT